MFQDFNFKFSVSVSVDGYATKREASACLSMAGARAVGREKMAFRRQQVDAPSLLRLATGGHAFCGLFQFDAGRKYWTDCGEQRRLSYPVYKRGNNAGAMKLSFKSDDYFCGAQLVFVDIDETRHTDLTAYVGLLQLQPTALYTSFSDTPVKRKFRMVYGFSRVMPAGEFRQVSAVIHQLVGDWTGEAVEDRCGTRPSQYMNGTSADAVTFVSGCVYDPEELLRAVTPPEAGSTAQETPTIAAAVPLIAPEVPTFDPQLVRDMEQLPYERVMHYYSRQYRYVYRTEHDEWTGEGYQLTGDDYVQLWHYRERVRDGNHRRRRLLHNACLRRLMVPGMDGSTLLFNLYVDRERYFDNTDGLITIDCLRRKAEIALRMSDDELRQFCASEISYWHDHRPEFIVAVGTSRSQGLPQRISRKLRMDRWREWYDPAKSVSENMANAPSGVSQRTVYRYLNGK